MRRGTKVGLYVIVLPLLEPPVARKAVVQKYSVQERDGDIEKRRLSTEGARHGTVQQQREPAQDAQNEACSTKHATPLLEQNEYGRRGPKHRQKQGDRDAVLRHG